LAKVNVPINKQCKLGRKVVDCVLLGYAFHSVVYRFFVVKFGVLDLLVDTIMESRDATFIEDIFPMRDEISSSRQESTEKVTLPSQQYVVRLHSLNIMRRVTMKPLGGTIDRGLKSLLVMISSYTS
jgi:hypothetical protein